MSRRDAIDQAAGAFGLAIVGVAPVLPEDGPQTAGLRSILLLGPRQPDFWRVFSASPELSDGAPHPIDRWSRRVGDHLAETLDARAFYPFGGPPYLPFYSWALRTGRAWASPIALLVGAEAGLWVSFRMALGVTETLDPTPARRPCDDCAAQPCRSACPVDAFSDGAYDVDRCRAHCATPAGRDCLEEGCRARRACPVGAALTPPPAQAAMHMRSFLGMAAAGEEASD